MRFSKTKIVILTAAVIVCSFALVFAVPSGAILAEADSRYQDAIDWQSDDFDDEELFDEGAAARPYRVLASAALSDILPVNDISELPLAMDSYGSAPIEANYTDKGYRDNTIIVEIEEIRQDDATYHVAYIKIATPSQLRTYVAGGIDGTRGIHATVMAKSVNAVAAINGDFFHDVSGGYIVRQGETARKKVSDNYDILLIDENADFHVVMAGKSIQKAAITELMNEHQIINSFFFGPALVVNGSVQQIPKDYAWNPNRQEPRAAIGQIAPLTYAVVSVDGRIDDSAGVTMQTLANFMAQIGCQQAYNLDGGNSSALVFHNELLTVKQGDERSINDIIYFASATDGE